MKTQLKQDIEQVLVQHLKDTDNESALSNEMFCDALRDKIDDLLDVLD